MGTTEVSLNIALARNHRIGIVDKVHQQWANISVAHLHNIDILARTSAHPMERLIDIDVVDLLFREDFGVERRVTNLKILHKEQTIEDAMSHIKR